jgi:hypothetical protein
MPEGAKGQRVRYSTQETVAVTGRVPYGICIEVRPAYQAWFTTGSFIYTVRRPGPDRVPAILGQGTFG